jgi:hypothetical protein
MAYLVDDDDDDNDDDLTTMSHLQGAETLYSEIHRLIRSIWNKEEFPQQWK